MTEKIDGLQDSDRSVCVQFMLDKGMTPTDARLLHGSFWKSERHCGMIHSTEDGGWIAAIWLAASEFGH